MDVSGEFKVAASPKRIVEALNDPEILKQAIPNCQAMRQIAPGQYEADIIPVIDTEADLFLYHFQVSELKKNREVALTWSTEAPTALLPSGGAVFKLMPHKGHTQVSHQTQMKVNPNESDDPAKDGQGIAFITALTDRFADMLRHHAGGTMSKHTKGKDFDRALHDLEDAAIELEHEAEVAAAKGFFGGAQMWGWLALAVIVIILLVLA